MGGNRMPSVRAHYGVKVLNRNRAPGGRLAVDIAACLAVGFVADIAATALAVGMTVGLDVG